MIAEFSVRNYHSIRTKQTLSFIPSPDRLMAKEYLHEVKEGVKLLKTAVVYGANASGKTNLLKALDTFRALQVNVPGDKLRGVGFMPFLLDDASRHEPTEMKMSFYLSGVRYDLELVYDAERILREELTMTETNRAALVFNRTYDAEADRADIAFGSKLKLSRKDRQAILANTINNCTVMAAFGKTNVERTRLDEVYEFFSKSLHAVLTPNALLSQFVKSELRRDNGGSLKRFLLEMLKLSDFNIVDMSLHEELSTREAGHAERLSFDHQGSAGVYSLPEELESVGTMRFMGMSVLLDRLLRTDSVVLIDEIESSIHYELVAYFLKLFLANGRRASQLLMTTHDINLLDEDFLRRDVIWSTDKVEGGETYLRRFSEMGLHKTLSVYNAYRQGKLGQLPFLGSIYLNHV
jgi:hypothetical protein